MRSTKKKGLVFKITEIYHRRRVKIGIMQKELRLLIANKWQLKKNIPIKHLTDFRITPLAKLIINYLGIRATYKTRSWNRCNSKIKILDIDDEENWRFAEALDAASF